VRLQRCANQNRKVSMWTMDEAEKVGVLLIWWWEWVEYKEEKKVAHERGLWFLRKAESVQDLKAR
jgi:hypothetical protein